MSNDSAAAESSSHQPASVERTLLVRVPGSTSNLGPGFDTLGLAVKLYNTVKFDLLDRDDPNVPHVSLVGETPMNRLPVDRSNHIFKVLSQHLPKQMVSRIRVTIDCAIPIGSGLGSSGTASLAALWATQRFNNAPHDQHFLLHEATRVEGHPDNVTPSLLGGFNISATVGTAKEVVYEPMAWPEDWELLFYVPSRELQTSHARSVLPSTVSLKDAVFNLQRVSLFLGAVANRDEAMLYHALDDKLHEPYRAELVPELKTLRGIAKHTGAVGCVLSGAGPTIMLLALRRTMPQVLKAVQTWAKTQEGTPRVLKLAVDKEGLKPLHE